MSVSTKIVTIFSPKILARQGFFSAQTPDQGIYSETNFENYSFSQQKMNTSDPFESFKSKHFKFSAHDNSFGLRILNLYNHCFLADTDISFQLKMSALEPAENVLLRSDDKVCVLGRPLFSQKNHCQTTLDGGTQI